MHIIRSVGWARLGGILAAALFLAFLAGPAAADDTIMLNDGHMYTGTIVSETDELIEIDTKIGNIATRMKIDRGRILSIVRDHREWTEEEEPSEETAEPDEQDAGVPVMEIPLVGEFGKDILPISFKASLDYAHRHHVKHIILRLNSPGGAVWSARQIMQEMEARRGEFRFHALVESAISASIWPTFCCETIHMAPKGVFGGTVAYHFSSRGNVEVDAKMNSIFASEIVTIAEALGHNGGVIRSMMLMESQLYATHDGDRVVLSTTRPADGQAFDVVDGPTTVLTLTTEDAVKFGIVRAMQSNTIEELMRSIGEDRVKVVDGGGLMERWSGECEKRQKLAESSAEKLMEAWSQYENTEYIDEAITALTAFQHEHPRFVKYYNEMLECFPTDESIDREKVAELSDAVHEAIAELRKLKREGP